jgi:hypothetical protein
MSRDIQYIGMDVHKEAVVMAVLNSRGNLIMESIVETKASSILQFIHGLRGELHVTWEEGTWAALRSFATNGVEDRCMKPLSVGNPLALLSPPNDTATPNAKPKSFPGRSRAWMQAPIEV